MPHFGCKTCAPPVPGRKSHLCWSCTPPKAAVPAPPRPTDRPRLSRAKTWSCRLFTLATGTTLAGWTVLPRRPIPTRNAKSPSTTACATSTRRKWWSMAATGRNGATLNRAFVGTRDTARTHLSIKRLADDQFEATVMPTAARGGLLDGDRTRPHLESQNR